MDRRDVGRARLGAGAESVLVCRQIQPTKRIPVANIIAAQQIRRAVAFMIVCDLTIIRGRFVKAIVTIL
jgi:hypothetical protein